MSFRWPDYFTSTRWSHSSVSCFKCCICKRNKGTAIVIVNVDVYVSGRKGGRKGIRPVKKLSGELLA